MVEVEPIKTTVEELRKLVNIQNFIGEPIEVEDKVIIPVSKVGVAFGIGENKSDKVLGGAAGGINNRRYHQNICRAYWRNGSSCRRGNHHKCR